ncbi:uncharacterized protein LOC126782251 [Argentina anserina]|uniref:uncharacterized protein LOC126782251 n=1 Tax=Argentina anserina TaxID=57926 RepID=UPI0021764D12|nr:uncharacterized protein LOC126782251 [Potentilla anserina]
MVIYLENSSKPTKKMRFKQTTQAETERERERVQKRTPIRSSNRAPSKFCGKYEGNTNPRGSSIGVLFLLQFGINLGYSLEQFQAIYGNVSYGQLPYGTRVYTLRIRPSYGQIPIRMSKLISINYWIQSSMYVYVYVGRNRFCCLFLFWLCFSITYLATNYLWSFSVLENHYMPREQWQKEDGVFIG